MVVLPGLATAHPGQCGMMYGRYMISAEFFKSNFMRLVQRQLHQLRELRKLREPFTNLLHFGVQDTPLTRGDRSGIFYQRAPRE